MTIIRKQRTLQKSELFETNGELTSEYTVSQIMIRKQRIITKQRISIGTSRKINHIEFGQYPLWSIRCFSRCKNVNSLCFVISLFCYILNFAGKNNMVHIPRPIETYWVIGQGF